MAYTRTTWVNGSGGGTPISAANLNNIEVELVALDAMLVGQYVDPVTSLPGSPVDKQQALLTDSLTAPTYCWLFQYDTGISDANKWMFIGGSSVIKTVAADEATSSASYTDLSTVGPTFTVPRAGLYRVAHGHQGGATNSSKNMQSIKIGSATAQDADGDTSAAGATNFNGLGVSRVLDIKTFAASDVIKCHYKSLDGTSTSFQKRWLEITPVRVA